MFGLLRSLVICSAQSVQAAASNLETENLAFERETEIHVQTLGPWL